MVLYRDLYSLILTTKTCATVYLRDQIQLQEFKVADKEREPFTQKLNLYHFTKALSKGLDSDNQPRCPGLRTIHCNEVAPVILNIFPSSVLFTNYCPLAK